MPGVIYFDYGKSTHRTEYNLYGIVNPGEYYRVLGNYELYVFINVSHVFLYDLLTTNTYLIAYCLVLSFLSYSLYSLLQQTTGYK
jgi:hypothetical protein